MPLVGYFCAALCAATVSITGTTIYEHGVPVGQYVDDTTPDQCQVVAQDLELGWPLVVAGVPPGASDASYTRCPGAVQAQEWYPFQSGYPPWAWGPIPAARAYILQWRFSFTGEPPTARERRRLYRQALKHRPWLILWY